MSYELTIYLNPIRFQRLNFFYTSNFY